MKQEFKKMQRNLESIESASGCMHIDDCSYARSAVPTRLLNLKADLWTNAPGLWHSRFRRARLGKHVRRLREVAHIVARRLAASFVSGSSLVFSDDKFIGDGFRPCVFGIGS
jgi:hypothetical protein